MFRRHAPVIAMCLALGGISAYAVFAYRLRTSPPVLSVVDPGLLELGEVNIQDQCTRTIRLLNSGAHQVTIDDIKASCGCVKAVPTATTLEPGETTDAVLSFDFLSVANRDDIPESKNFSVNLYAITKPPQRAVFTWQLSATVKSVFRRVPEFVEFRSCGSASEPVNGSVTVTFHRNIDDIEVHADEPMLDMQVEREASQPTFHIHVAGRPHEMSRSAIELQIAPVIGRARQSPIASRIQLKRVVDVRAEPEFVSLGIVNHHKPPVARLRLVSSESAEFQVLNTQVQASEVRGLVGGGSVVRDPMGDTRDFVFTPDATDPGTHTGTVIFDVQQQEEKYEVAVPYSFHIDESTDHAVDNFSSGPDCELRGI